ncbi:MAG: tetratricopeptide repeat protein [Crocinitomicaceae bacterium]|nr:tetratricopeptide repeat protein [Crocinitomicaceae bacterium]
MKQFLASLSLVFFSAIAFGQDFKSQFDAALQDSDTSMQRQILQQWEVQDPQNAELFTSYFNYYFYKARMEVVSLSSEQPNAESLEIKDSTGNVAGFLASNVVYDQATLKHGFDKIDEGIRLYPNRLDMRFGKIYGLGVAEDWESFTNEIVKTIQYSAINKNEWTWTFNEKREHGEELLLSSVQNYQLTLYETENDALLPFMRTIANEILKLYPKSIESLSNLSITYLLTDDFDKAIEVLLRAEKISPKDGIVLGNIAQGYKLKGDIGMAKKYYKKMLKLDDENSVAFAKKQLEKLGK